MQFLSEASFRINGLLARSFLMRRKIKWCFKRKLLGDVVFGGWLCQSYCSEAELRFAEGLGCAGPDPQPFAVSSSSQTVKLFQTPLPVISSMLKRLEICRQQSDSWTTRRNIRWVRLRAGALLAVNWILVLIEDPVLPPCAEVWEQQPVLRALAVCHIAVNGKEMHFAFVSTVAQTGA